MLKAVRFDENEHKELLDFIINFIDNKGKKNESEAIRFLMKKGLDTFNTSTPQQITVDIDKIKAELFQQIMMSIGSIQQREQVFTPVTSSENIIAVMNKDAIAKAKPIEVKKHNSGEEDSSKPATSSNPLIDNMLANRNKR